MHELTIDQANGAYRCSVCGQRNYGETGGPGHSQPRARPRGDQDGHD